MKALILENSRLYRQLLESILGQHGFDNDITDEIAIARDYLDQNSYDLICLNEHLKDGSGLLLAQHISQQDRHRTTPLLFLTANPDFEVTQLQTLRAEVIVKRNIQQISDQIVHFLEEQLDPLFGQGRILLVEDSQSIAQMLETALTDQGYQVELFAAAEQAWQEFIDEVSYGSDVNAYDLVITDINLTGKMTGLDLTRHIRALDDARGLVPIMAITSKADANLRLSLYRSGINDFVQKPILADELAVRASNLMNGKRLLDKVHDQRRELYLMATTDKLTGCHNRHSLMEASSKLISQAIRHEFPVSLMVIDLDHFKSINDTHGHATGDLVLAETGKLLLQNFRNEDLVARFGGEEFVILLDHCDAASARVKAEQLRAAVEAMQPAGIRVTASIGVATLQPPEQHDFETLFNRGDEGVYKAKELGRNQVQFVDSPGSTVSAQTSTL